MTYESPYTLIPPFFAFLIALWRKNIVIALTASIILTEIMMSGGDPFKGLVNTFYDLKKRLDIPIYLEVTVICLLIGAIMELIARSGGVSAFIKKIYHTNLIRSAKTAALLPGVIGCSIFMESNLSMFTSGMMSQALFDKYKLGRARLAYIIDSTTSPVSVLFFFNSWGAFIIGLLYQEKMEGVTSIILESIIYNFYPWICLIFVFFTIFSGKTFGLLARVDGKIETIVEHSEDNLMEHNGKVRYMLLPIFLIFSISLILISNSGFGKTMVISGTESVMWGVVVSFIFLVFLLLKDHVFSVKYVWLHSMNGMKKNFVVVVILLLSTTFSEILFTYGAGNYLSNILSYNFTVQWLVPVVFLTACIISFITGTSWSTFALLIPIVLPLADSVGLPTGLLLASILSGGVFGDHSSPISDTTIIASLASGCDHTVHVKSQISYNLFAALIAFFLFYLASLFLLN